MLIAEDLLLLATDDATGKITVSSMNLEPALAGAVVMELMVAGRVTIEGEARQSMVVVTDRTPLGDPVLDAALLSLIDKAPLKPGAAIQRLTKGLRDRLNGQLEEHGLLRREPGKVLGVFRPPGGRRRTPDMRRRSEVTLSASCATAWSRTRGPPCSSRC